MAYVRNLIEARGDVDVGASLAAAAAAWSLSAADWAIVRLARADGLWTIRPIGRWRRFLNWLFNLGSMELANPRLEAIRRIAVRVWHDGSAVPTDEMEAFLAAGFTPYQFQSLAAGIAAARRPS